MRASSTLPWPGPRVAAVLLGLCFASAPLAAQTIAQGYYHASAIRENGLALSWGNIELDPAQFDPGSLGPLKAMASSAGSTIGLTAAGQVVSWGRGAISTPAIPSGLGQVVGLAAGQNHFLAIRADGTVVAWGSNYAGETSVPVNLEQVVQVAGGSMHSLALKADGSVVVWGLLANTLMAPPASATGIKAIAVGQAHNLALRTNGTVVAWGHSAGGAGIVPPGLGSVVAIAAGEQHSLALKSDGTVVAWGANLLGSCNVPPGLDQVVAISAKGSGSLALRADGSLVYWGDTRNGLANLPSDKIMVSLPNLAPLASASALFINSQDQASAVAQGNASDPDGDALTYRWFEGQNPLGNPLPVGPDGACPLLLGALPPFAPGQHDLTLEVSDGKAVTRAGMILTVANSAPTVVAQGGGTFALGEPVILGGAVADFDGDALACDWLEGGVVLDSHTVLAAPGGAPATLPASTVANLPLGQHTFTLRVNDGVNAPATDAVAVTVTDTQAPTLAPTVSPAILWPPNGSMVPVQIRANAADNSGQPVALEVFVVSNEASPGVPIATEPVIDAGTGTVQLGLLAARNGKGKGRSYTVTLRGTDGSGNQSTAQVVVAVPHDRGK